MRKVSGLGFRMVASGVEHLMVKSGADWPFSCCKRCAASIVGKACWMSEAFVSFLWDKVNESICMEMLIILLP